MLEAKIPPAVPVNVPKKEIKATIIVLSVLITSLIFKGGVFYVNTSETDS